MKNLISIIAFVVAFAAVRIGMDAYRDWKDEKELNQAIAQVDEYTTTISQTEDLGEMRDATQSQLGDMDVAIPALEKLARHSSSKQYVADLKENASLMKRNVVILGEIDNIVQKYENSTEEISEAEFNHLCEIAVENYEGLKKLQPLFERRVRFLKDPNVIRDFKFLAKGTTAVQMIGSVELMHTTNQDSIREEEVALRDLGCL